MIKRVKGREKQHRYTQQHIACACTACPPVRALITSVDTLYRLCCTCCEVPFMYRPVPLEEVLVCIAACTCVYCCVYYVFWYEVVLDYHSSNANKHDNRTHMKCVCVVRSPWAPCRLVVWYRLASTCTSCLGQCQTPVAGSGACITPPTRKR